MALDALTILVSRSAQTASFNSNPINVPDAGFPDNGFIYELLVSAASGTTPTLSATIQISVDGGATYQQAGTFRNPNAPGTDIITGPGRYYAHVRRPTPTAAAGVVYPMKLRASGTIGGTAPSFTVQIGETLSFNG